MNFKNLKSRFLDAAVTTILVIAALMLTDYFCGKPVFTFERIIAGLVLFVLNMLLPPSLFSKKHPKHPKLDEKSSKEMDELFK